MNTRAVKASYEKRSKNGSDNLSFNTNVDCHLPSLKFYGSAKQNAIPRQYQAVEYIYAERINTSGLDDMPYIQYDFGFNGITKIESDIAVLSAVGAGNIIWAVKSESRYVQAGYYTRSTTNCAGATVTADGDLSDGQRHLVTISGISVSSTTSLRSRWDNSWLCPQKEYGHKMYDSSNELVHDMQPCYRTADNAIGMYDLVTETFYAASGTFTVGANVTISKELPRSLTWTSVQNEIIINSSSFSALDETINLANINNGGLAGFTYDNDTREDVYNAIDGSVRRNFNIVLLNDISNIEEDYGTITYRINDYIAEHCLCSFGGIREVTYAGIVLDIMGTTTTIEATKAWFTSEIAAGRTPYAYVPIAETTLSVPARTFIQHEGTNTIAKTSGIGGDISVDYIAHSGKLTYQIDVMSRINQTGYYATDETIHSSDTNWIYSLDVDITGAAEIDFKLYGATTVYSVQIFDSNGTRLDTVTASGFTFVEQEYMVPTGGVMARFSGVSSTFSQSLYNQQYCRIVYIE